MTSINLKYKQYFNFETLDYSLFEDQDKFWSFMKQVFYSNGEFSTNDYSISIFISSSKFLDFFKSKCNIPFKQEFTSMKFVNSNALDFLYKIYKNAEIDDTDQFYKNYLKLAGTISGINVHSHFEPQKEFEFKWAKLRPDAVAPFKERASDAGWDLTLIEKIDDDGLIETYSTGISVQEPPGWFFMMTPRSSIYKTGRMLANSIAILDQNYTGECLVKLAKLRDNVLDLELPIRLVQLIPAISMHFNFKEVERLDETARGGNRFGSTGK